MRFPIPVFTCGLADMGAENVEHGLAQLWGIFRQMEEFVCPAQAHRVLIISQVFNGIFHALLPQSLLGI